MTKKYHHDTGIERAPDTVYPKPRAEPDKRYIDDIVGAASWRREDLEDYIMHVSTFHLLYSTRHTTSQTQLPFLDVTLKRLGQ